MLNIRARTDTPFSPTNMLQSTTKILLCNARAPSCTIYDLSLPHITSQRKSAL
jgi:hypothetical protein